MTTTTKTPWHLWTIGAAMLLWGGLSGYDYVMSVTVGTPYLRASGMTPAQVAYFTTLPIWVSLAWTASVWGFALAGLALVLRRAVATPLLATSLTGTLAYILWTCLLSDGIAAMGAMWFMPALVAAITAVLIAYTWRLRRLAVLNT